MLEAVGVELGVVEAHWGHPAGVVLSHVPTLFFLCPGGAVGQWGVWGVAWSHGLLYLTLSSQVGAPPGLCWATQPPVLVHSERAACWGGEARSRRMEGLSCLVRSDPRLGNDPNTGALHMSLWVSTASSSTERQQGPVPSEAAVSG